MFVPGQSGNPSGRPRKTLVQKEFEELAKKHAQRMLDVLLEVALDKEAPASARAASAGTVIDRAYGRATQPIEQDVNVFNYGIADRQPSPDEWLDKYTAMHGQNGHIAH